MIDWWVVLGSTIWAGGLAVELAAVSVASYRAGVEGSRLRHRLGEPGLVLTLYAGLALFCTGLVLSSPAWWQRVVSGLLAVFFWVHTARRRLRQAGAVEITESRGEAGQRSGRWLGWGLLLAGLVVVASWGLLTGLQIRPQVRSLRAHLAALEGYAEGEGLFDPAAVEAMGQHLRGTHANLAAIGERIGPLLPLGRLLRWAPVHGGDLAAAAELLELATRVSAAGQIALDALSPALRALVGQQGGLESLESNMPGFLALAAAARPDLVAAQQELASARDVRAGLRAGRLSPQVAGYVARLDQLLPLLESAVDGGLALPSILGAGGVRTYLVLVQNSDELRPTGGFISGVGEVRLENGRLTLSRFDDSYAVDDLAVPHELAPPDLQRTLFGDLWFFRDTNWDADFRVSARRAVEVYARDRGVRADGAIALDMTVLKGLLDVLGPLQVEGSAEPVTAASVEGVIQAGWDRSGPEREGEWWLHRKDLMGEIASATIQHLVTSPGLPLPDLAGTLNTALREKHLLLYVSDASAGSLLRRQNWDGALRTPDGSSDRLLVVDSNVGFNKADASVTRFVDYRVDLTVTGQPRAELALTYRHGAADRGELCVQEARYGDTYLDMTERCYWDYVRIHVPAGSRLLASPDLALPGGSLSVRKAGLASQTPLHPGSPGTDWDVWAEFFDLAPGAERVLTFRYILPRGVLEMDSVGRMHYRLLVQKQPGTEAVPLRLEIGLPPDVEVVRTVPQKLAPELSIITDLRTDRQFEIVFLRK